jgi:hypothetical protein
MSQLWADLLRYSRFVVRLRHALRHPLTPDEARVVVRRRMAERETNFLRTVEVAIFRNPRSPYLPLLARAGCGFDDIKDMVRAKGLEATLEALRAAGVYVTLEEFKGRTPSIVRHGQATAVRSQDFDNPNLAPGFQAETGGTSGPGIKVWVSVDNLAAQAPDVCLGLEAHGVLGRPMAQWRGILPNTSGINNLLRGGAFIGQVHAAWFSPFWPGGWRLRRLKPRLATALIIAVGRLSGVRLPWPQRVGLDQALVVARWANQAVAEHGLASLRCSASMALRVSIAASEHGLTLAGLTLFTGGEPSTPAKIAGITRSGARWVPTYASTETGNIGIGCARPGAGVDVHLYKDLHAVIQGPRQVAGSAGAVPAFYFTTLYPGAPKILLNTEIGDYGVLESRSCGCPLEGYGFTTHVRDIQSFGLLTSEGTTLLAVDMIRVLEEVLPARFGGSPLDYQMIEEEDADGFSRLTLLVHPRIHLVDEAEVVRTVVAHSRGVNRALWTAAGTIRVKRAEPVTTARGKFVPLRLAPRRGSAEPATPGTPGV